MLTYEHAANVGKKYATGSYLHVEHDRHQSVKAEYLMKKSGWSRPNTDQIYQTIDYLDQIAGFVFLICDQEL